MLLVRLMHDSHQNDFSRILDPLKRTLWAPILVIAGQGRALARRVKDMALCGAREDSLLRVLLRRFHAGRSGTG